MFDPSAKTEIPSIIIKSFVQRQFVLSVFFTFYQPVYIPPPLFVVRNQVNRQEVGNEIPATYCCSWASGIRESFQMSLLG